MVKGPPKFQKKTIDKICVDLRRSFGVSIFRFVKYDTLHNDDRNKIEEAMVEMISNFKLAPSEIEKKIPQDLYDRLKIR